jgi:hypothetical protein
VRRGQEQHIAGFEVVLADEGEPGLPAQVRMRGVHRPPGVAVRGDLRQLDHRMLGQEPDRLAADVAAGPDHGSLHAHKVSSM